MREGIKTSLISLICATAVSAGLAAPSVRAVGGTGTYTSAANATASRSGSLRATGGFVRPTAATTSSLKAATTPTTSAATATATPAAGGATSTAASTTGRVAASPRLSIGKYVGTPKAVSSSNPSSELTQRLDKLESDVDRLGDEKQNALQGSDYITIEDDELVLKLDKIRDDLNIRSGTDGREVEIGTNDNALVWHYKDEDTWTPLIEWSTLKSRMDLGDVGETVATLSGKISTMNDAISEKLNATVDRSLAGQALVVDEDGHIVPGGTFANADNVYTKDKVYTKDEVYNKDEVYTKDQVYNKDQVYGKEDVFNKTEVYAKTDTYNKSEINSQFSGVNLELANKVDVYQGPEKVGKPLVIDAMGNVIVSDKDIPTIDNIGDLAFKDTISNGDVDDATLERSKMAASITDTLAWIDEWRNSMPATDGERYVFAIDENGDAGWFRVAE